MLLALTCLSPQQRSNECLNENDLSVYKTTLAPRSQTVVALGTGRTQGLAECLNVIIS